MENVKVALVTGSGAGIGRSIALRLASDGFSMAVNDIRQENADAVTEEIKAFGVPCLPIVADVANEEQVKAMVERVIAEYGRVDVLVNNAGICPIRPLQQISLQDFERTMRINLCSIFLCSKLVSEHMIRQGGGKIINAASQSAFQQSSLTIEYATSKWAIRGLTRTLAAALAPHNITVNAYCPGKVWSEMQDQITERVCALTGIEPETYKASMLTAIPLGRLQPPEDIAAFVSFLASDGANNITGQNVLINGGQIMN